MYGESPVKKWISLGKTMKPIEYRPVKILTRETVLSAGERDFWQYLQFLLHILYIELKNPQKRNSNFLITSRYWKEIYFWA